MTTGGPDDATSRSTLYAVPRLHQRRLGLRERRRRRDRAGRPAADRRRAAAVPASGSGRCEPRADAASGSAGCSATTACWSSSLCRARCRRCGSSVSSFKTGRPGLLRLGGLIPDPLPLQGYEDAFGRFNLARLPAEHGALRRRRIGSARSSPRCSPPTRWRAIDFLGRNALVASFSLALAIPVVGLATPEFFVMRELGLFDCRVGFVVFYSALLLPAVVRDPAGVPREPAERARGGGPHRRRQLLHDRPADRDPAVAAGARHRRGDRVRGIWNEFFFANLLSASSETQNAQVALSSFSSQFGNFNASAMLARDDGRDARPDHRRSCCCSARSSRG